MPFPKVKRVVYKKNTLETVVCQLRFPPILRIDTDAPADFQDQVRADFPEYGLNTEINIQLPSEVSGHIPPDVLKQIFPSETKNYEFVSEDGDWKINLTNTFIALSARNYERWEVFKEKLEIPLNALINIYSPSYFSRVGLRYVNLIKRSSLGLDDVRWSELLQQYILGILISEELSDNVRSFEHKYEIGLLDNESLVRLVTKQGKTGGSDELCYMIDSDFHKKTKTDITAATEKLDFFNARASRLFQWCITDRLHQAMKPQELEP